MLIKIFWNYGIIHRLLRNNLEVHMHDNFIDFKKIFSKIFDYFFEILEN